MRQAIVCQRAASKDRRASGRWSCAARQALLQRELRAFLGVQSNSAGARRVQARIHEDSEDERSQSFVGGDNFSGWGAFRRGFEKPAAGAANGRGVAAAKA